MEDKTIIYALEKMEKMFPLKIVRQVGAYIVIADNHADLYTKANRVHEGKDDGFYTIEQALEL